jgi:hypothetical protein
MFDDICTQASLCTYLRMPSAHSSSAGQIIEKWLEKDSLWFKLSVSADYLKYIVTKGFIALDGASLTICDVGPSWFTVMLVPHTQNNIIFPQKIIGDEVNIEVDIQAKLIERSINQYLHKFIDDNTNILQLVQENIHLKEEINTLRTKVEHIYTHFVK